MPNSPDAFLQILLDQTTPIFANLPPDRFHVYYLHAAAAAAPPVGPAAAAAAEAADPLNAAF